MILSILFLILLSLNSFHSETYAKLCYDNKKINVKVQRTY